jgi:hypothetical protein
MNPTKRLVGRTSPRKICISEQRAASSLKKIKELHNHTIAERESEYDMRLQMWWSAAI